MNLEGMISELEREGYRVRIAHERCTAGDVELALSTRRVCKTMGVPFGEVDECFPATVARHELKGSEISPFGGKTIASLLKDGVVVAAGESICAPTDPFVKYDGSVRALGRAISELRRKS